MSRSDGFVKQKQREEALEQGSLQTASAVDTTTAAAPGKKKKVICFGDSSDEDEAPAKKIKRVQTGFVKGFQMEEALDTSEGTEKNAGTQKKQKISFGAEDAEEEAV